MSKSIQQRMEQAKREIRNETHLYRRGKDYSQMSVEELLHARECNLGSHDSRNPGSPTAQRIGRIEALLRKQGVVPPGDTTGMHTYGSSHKS